MARRPYSEEFSSASGIDLGICCRKGVRGNRVVRHCGCRSRYQMSAKDLIFDEWGSKSLNRVNANCQAWVLNPSK